MSTHPPLNTPLSAFTPAMLGALPVGSEFSRSDCLPIVRCETGWRDEGSGNTPKTVWTSEEVARCFHSRTLTRVGPEQASEPAPSATLPDPWPGYLVAFTYADVTRRHAIRDSATVNGETVFCPAGGFSEDVYLDWTPDVVQEVRTPDGTTLWKRPAAKVTAEPRPLSTYTADEIRAFPVGTEADDATEPVEAFRKWRLFILTADGWVCEDRNDTLTMDEFIVNEAPDIGAYVVHFPAKVTP